MPELSNGILYDYDRVIGKHGVLADLHCHNRFDWKYRPYRKDWQGDARYIWAKQRAEAAQLT